MARPPEGDPGLTYLGAGYRRYFEPVAPYRDYMKGEYMAQRAPANVMDAIRRGELGRD